MKITLSNLKAFIWVVLYIILWWPSKNGIIKYTDEVVTLICLINIIIKILKNKALLKEEYLILLFTSLLLIFGVVSSITAKIGQEIFPMAVDLFSLMKVPITYIYFKYNFPETQKINLSICYFLLVIH